MPECPNCHINCKQAESDNIAYIKYKCPMCEFTQMEEI